jgi:hypothetical protein
MPGVTDNQTEVQIRSTVSKLKLNFDDASVDSLVTHTVGCVWCPGYTMTPDVRDAIKIANDHEMSLGHTHSREEALKEGRPRRELWD